MSNEIKKKVVYVAGKMRGVPYYNFPAFDKARDRLAGLGFEVLSPADMDRAAGFDPTIWSSIMLLAITASSWSKTPSSFDLDAAIKRDNEAIDRADAIYVIHERIAESAGGMAEIERGMKAGKIVLFDTMSDERILRAMGLYSKERLKSVRDVIEKLCEPLHSQMVGCVQVESVKPSPSGAWETITDAPENPPYTLRAMGVGGVPAGYGIFGKRPEPSPLGDRVASAGSFFDTYRGETRYTDPKTGGQKGEKLARFDLLPPDILTELAEHYGKGARKYGERNMEKGYPWSKTYAACHRHLNSFWQGEDVDAETGSLHLIAAAWHCFTMAWFLRHNAGTDDRPVTGKKGDTHE